MESTAVVLAPDPVCSAYLPKGKVLLVSDHEGETYYFCSFRCKLTFERDPTRYTREKHIIW
ncbi:MAG: YHS domain-containing protein [Chloroflexi bacterium]|nr:YHS domain-containing protein [Chloroflexota bacterium]